MQMEVYYSKTLTMALLDAPEGVVLAKLDENGKPGKPELVYQDSIENVFHEYSRLGIDDWQLVDSIEIGKTYKE